VHLTKQRQDFTNAQSAATHGENTDRSANQQALKIISSNINP